MLFAQAEHLTIGVTEEAAHLIIVQLRGRHQLLQPAGTIVAKAGGETSTSPSGPRFLAASPKNGCDCRDRLGYIP